MPNHHLHLEAAAAVDTPHLTAPVLQTERLDYPLSPGQFLFPLRHAIAALHRRNHQGRGQAIIRFKNDYGAIISEYRLLEGMFEVAPLRVHGLGPDDFEFHFRSHLAYLSWCGHRDELLAVCEQIARLLPPGMV